MLIRVSHTKKVNLPGTGDSESFTTTIDREIDAPAWRGRELAGALFEQAAGAVEEQIRVRGLVSARLAGPACRCENGDEAAVVIQYADSEDIEGEPYLDRNGDPYQKCRSRCGKRFLVFTHNEGVYPVSPGDRVLLRRNGRYWNVADIA